MVIPPPPPLPPQPAVAGPSRMQPTLTRIERAPLSRIDSEAGPRVLNDEPPPLSFITAMNILNTITHLSLGAISFIAIYVGTLIEEPDSLRQHIYLCVSGYIILMSQAVLSMNPYNGWSKALKFQQKKTIHWIIQIIGSALAIAGSVIRIVDIEDAFQTPHGIFGLVAMLLTFVSLIGGVINLFSKKIPLPSEIVKICHGVLGSLTLAVAFTTLCLGFSATFFREFIGDITTNTAIALTVFAMIGTLLSPFVRIFERLFH